MSRRYRLSLLMGCPVGGLPSLSPACPATALPCWVARLFWSLANPAFSFFSPPSPCPPSPPGKGEIFLFSYARGFAPCIPGIRPPAALTEPAMQVTGGGAFPRRCRLGGRWRYPAEGSGFGRLLTLPLWCPAGVCPLCRLLTPPLALFLPLSPQPPSPPGKGEIFCFLMQGASPLASPALDRLRHLQNLPCR